MDKENVEIKIVDLFLAKENKKIRDKEFDISSSKMQEEIIEYMNKMKTDILETSKGNLSGSSLRCKLVKNTSIVFDAWKLEKKLSKDKANKCINKRVEINNLEGLVKMLKSYGVDPKEFKKFIDVSKTVDTKSLDRMSELGEISLEDIKGCYSTKTSNGYLRISKVKD